MAHAVTPFLMFQGGVADAAMQFYVSLFEDSAIEHVDRYGPGEQGPEGSIKRAEFTVAGQTVYCIDSPIAHAFGFTPSFSLFAECETLDELERAFGQLAEGGSVLMPLDDYGFSRRFGWVTDRFGVSWQLNLA